MAQAKSHSQLQEDLQRFVEGKCPGVQVAVEHSDRWKRTCFTFRWAGFEELLLEERFRLLAKCVPPDFFQAHCAEAVWLELTPGEDIDAFLAQPRSEDVDEQLDDIWSRLETMRFFEALEDELVRIPPRECPDDFTVSRRVFAAKNATDDETRDALLAFMRQKAYNDWEVLRQVKPIAQPRRKRKT